MESFFIRVNKEAIAPLGCRAVEGYVEFVPCIQAYLLRQRLGHL
jgi:hypothetical protein